MLVLYDYGVVYFSKVILLINKDMRLVKDRIQSELLQVEKCRCWFVWKGGCGVNSSYCMSLPNVHFVAKNML